MDLNSKILPAVKNKIELLSKIKPVEIVIVKMPKCRGALINSDVKTVIMVSLCCNHSEEMLNWTLTHEIAHIDLQHNKNIFCYEDTIETLPEEIEANNYAAEFLLPEELLYSCFKASNRIYSGLQKLYYIKSFFGVSYEVLKYRLDKLNIMKISEFEKYF